MADIIDGHVHLWPFPARPGETPLDPPGTPFPRDLDGRAERLIEEMNRHAISRAIAVQSPWWADDDRYLLEVSELYAGRFTPVGCLPLMLRDADLASQARRIGRDGMQGLRVHLTGPDALAIFASRDLDPIYRALSDRGLPVLLLSRSAASHDLYHQVAAAFPDLRIVVEHMGFAVTPPFGGTTETAENFLRLVRHPNLFVKLAVHHQHSQTPYPWRDLHPLQHRFIAEFGAPRLFWGSNWPMRPDEVTFEERIEVLTRHFDFPTADDRAWVMGGTAARLWPEACRTAAP